MRRVSTSLFILLFVFLHNANCVKITLEQMKQAAEPVKLVCIPKTKVSEDALAGLKEGKLTEQKELKCYINCVLEMMQTVSENSLKVSPMNLNTPPVAR